MLNLSHIALDELVAGFSEEKRESITLKKTTTQSEKSEFPL